MRDENVKLSVHYSPPHGEYQLWGCLVDRWGNPTHELSGVTAKEYDTSSFGVERHPLLSFNQAAAQKLMDSLWDGGIRPSEMRGGTAQHEALKYHLEDMRTLVFGRRQNELAAH